MRLEEIVKGGLCAGCGLCASIIEPGRAAMKFDDRGFLRPHLTEPPNAAEERLIDQVCPGRRLEMTSEQPTDDPVWGAIAALHTGYATNEELRFKGSSGGALSAIIRHLIDTRAADYVLHVGADREFPWLNRIGESTTHEQIAVRAGSRYGPSAPLADIVQRLKEPRRFVFVGKPCDIAGLRMLARYEPLVDQKVVAMISFMCGGVPSEKGTQALLERMRVSPNDVSSFRYRGYGWPGRATARLRDGREVSLSYAESWGGVLSQYVQLRCKICPDGVGRFADVVCADAWFGDERGYPSFEERDGRSLVMARTEKGVAIIADAVKDGAIVLEATDIPMLERMQPFQARRTRLVRSRVLAMALLWRRIPSYRGLRLWRASWQASFVAQLRALLGTMRRIAIGRM